MKIIFDGLIYYLQKKGGISRYFDELINGFSVRKDCEVIVLLRKNKIDKIFNKNIKVVMLDSTINLDNKIKKYISVFRDKQVVNNFLKHYNLSDYIFHYSYYSYYKNLKIKSVLTVHDLVHEKFPNFFNGFLNKIYLINKKKSIKKAESLISISKKTKQDLVDIYKIKSEKINVVYHGLDKNFRVLNENKRQNFLLKKNITKPYLLFVGNRGLYKNFNFLLKAYSEWSKNIDYDLYCIGGGKFTDNEELLINKFHLKNKIKLFLNVSEWELVNFYNCSIAFVYPSLYEGFGLPIIEAMACGTIVLASDIDIFHEIGNEVPIYFNPIYIESLIQSFDLALLNNKKKIKLGLELVVKYSWKNTIKKTLEIYQDLL